MNKYYLAALSVLAIFILGCEAKENDEGKPRDLAYFKVNDQQKFLKLLNKFMVTNEFIKTWKAPITPPNLRGGDSIFYIYTRDMDDVELSINNAGSQRCMAISVFSKNNIDSSKDVFERLVEIIGKDYPQVEECFLE